MRYRGPETNRPSTRKRRVKDRLMKVMVRMTWDALSLCPCPMCLAHTAETPVAVPTAMAVTICCIGKARETAVSAFSEILATNMESTMLYMAWMKKEIIIGRLIFSRTRWTGSSAIMVIRSFRLIFLPDIDPGHPAGRGSV
ncbi:MAG: hypothetical protein IKD71_03435 [Solobacterium sp.]|nr:hypothetical protein [Solobacterium sp.]